MDWSGQGYILSSRKHGENSAIIDVFTREHGRHAGLVKGGTSRRMRPVLQPGNQVVVDWRGRLEDHLGYYQVEPLDSRAAELMDSRLSLAGLNALCTMTRELLPEREAYPSLYDVFSIVVSQLDQAEIWPAENLTHVSPRSGRAVCAVAAEPYADRMLKLPDFMKGERTVSPDDIAQGLRLTAYFLETRVQWEINRTLPEARDVMVERLIAEGLASNT